MKITSSYFNYNQTNNCSAKYNTSFTNHPDFDVLIKKWPLCASGYFRRGITFGEPSERFIDIVKIFRNVFKNTVTPKKMLIVGIANSEEPFSYLATIKQLNETRPIEDILDLHIIDLQSKTSREALFNYSYDTEYIPFYAKKSFVYSPHPQIPLYNYRINDELFEFLYKTYNDPSKSKWETRVQDAITTYPDNYFDIISINNVIYYIKDKPVETFNNVYRVVKPDGYIISDDNDYSIQSKKTEYLELLSEGLYRKIK